ncbi:basic salivary proline-rich protein 1-like [Delphinus delphis]|uniref:basic salivary proline-rich protein 1-like n=1 Tax=Delphinus delphis TaxID=9728 RepID=UPI003750603A
MSPPARPPARAPGAEPRCRAGVRGGGRRPRGRQGPGDRVPLSRGERGRAAEAAAAAAAARLPSERAPPCPAFNRGPRSAPRGRRPQRTGPRDSRPPPAGAEPNQGRPAAEWATPCKQTSPALGDRSPPDLQAAQALTLVMAAFHGAPSSRPGSSQQEHHGAGLSRGKERLLQSRRPTPGFLEGRKPGRLPGRLMSLASYRGAQVTRLQGEAPQASSEHSRRDLGHLPRSPVSPPGRQQRQGQRDRKPPKLGINQETEAVLALRVRSCRNSQDAGEEVGPGRSPGAFSETRPENGNDPGAPGAEGAAAGFGPRVAPGSPS